MCAKKIMIKKETKNKLTINIVKKCLIKKYWTMERTKKLNKFKTR